MQSDVRTGVINRGKHISRSLHLEVDQRHDVRIIRKANDHGRWWADQLLVDQHLIAGRDHRAAAPTHGRSIVQYGFLELADDFHTRAQVHELLADILPFRFELLDGI